MLRPVGDEDVLRVAAHRPRDPDVAAHGLPQAEETGRIGIPARRVRAGPQLGGHQPAPGVEREQSRVGHADAEVVRCGVTRRDRCRAWRSSRARGRTAPVRRRALGSGGGTPLGDEGAGPDPGDEEALRDEPFVRGGDRPARQLEPRGELPRRRQAVPGAEPPVTDRLAQLAVQPGGEVAGAGEGRGGGPRQGASRSGTSRATEGTARKPACRSGSSAPTMRRST